jgi:hypothetical protein
MAIMVLLLPRGDRPVPSDDEESRLTEQSPATA